MLPALRAKTVHCRLKKPGRKGTDASLASSFPQPPPTPIARLPRRPPPPPSEATTQVHRGELPGDRQDGGGHGANGSLLLRHPRRPLQRRAAAAARF
jgi:hypothetical protein